MTNIVRGRNGNLRPDFRPANGKGLPVGFEFYPKDVLRKAPPDGQEVTHLTIAIKNNPPIKPSPSYTQVNQPKFVQKPIPKPKKQVSKLIEMDDIQFLAW